MFDLIAYRIKFVAHPHAGDKWWVGGWQVGRGGAGPLRSALPAGGLAMGGSPTPRRRMRSPVSPSPCALIGCLSSAPTYVRPPSLQPYDAVHRIAGISRTVT